MSVLTGGSGPPLGLDIGSAAVKLVALSRHRGRYRMDGFAMEPLPASAVDTGNISDAATVGEAVRRACRAASTRRRTAIVAVADSAVITRTLLLDAALTPTELDVEVVLEAERCIPYPIDSVALDFAVIGPFPGEPGLNRVLLVACPQEQVAAREAVLRHAGLEPAALEVESLALRRAASLAGADEAGDAVLDVGDSAVRLVGWDTHDTAFTEQEPLPVGSDADEELTIRLVCTAASRLLEAYAADRPGQRLQRLLVVGGGAARPRFRAAAAECLGVAVEPANPFLGMPMRGRVDEAALAATVPALAIACGLALRGRR